MKNKYFEIEKIITDWVKKSDVQGEILSLREDNDSIVASVGYKEQPYGGVHLIVDKKTKECSVFYMQELENLIRFNKMLPIF